MQWMFSITDLNSSPCKRAEFGIPLVDTLRVTCNASYRYQAIWQNPTKSNNIVLVQHLSRVKHQVYFNMEFNIGINLQVPKEFVDELFTHIGFPFKYMYGTQGHTCTYMNPGVSKHQVSIGLRHILKYANKTLSTLMWQKSKWQHH